jgi:hypothetical protein
MDVEQQLSVAYQAAAGNVGIAEHHAAARMFLGIGANQGKDVGIVVKMGIVVIHNLHLAEVNALEAQIDIRGRQEIEPELGFRLTHIGNAAASAP